MVSIPMRRVISIAAALLFLVAGPGDAQETEPLQKSDIVRLLATPGADQGDVAAEIRARCLTFVPNARDLEDFGRLGATQEVIGAIRTCATPTVARTELRPASSSVTARVGTTATVAATVARGGRPVPDVRVVLRGSGRLSGAGGRDQEETSGPDGTVSFSLPVGTRPGTFDLTLAAVGTEEIADRPVSVRVVPGSAARLAGLPESASADEDLALALALRDPYGNPVAGARVAVRAGADRGAPLLFEGTTDGRGEIRVTIGAPSLAGLESVVVFGPDGMLGSTRIEPGAAAVESIVFVSGTDQVADAGAPFGLPLVAEVRDADGHPVAGVEVRATVENGSLLEAAPTTDARGRAAVSVEAGTRGWVTAVRVAVGETVAVVELPISRSGFTEDSLEALIVRADSLLEAGSPSAAQPLYERAASLDPARTSALLGLAASEAALGDLEAAEQTYRSILRASPASREAQLGLARVMEAMGRPGDAATWYQLALGRSPEDVATWVSLGDARREAGDMGAARNAYERALALDPENAQAREGLSRLTPGEPIVRGWLWVGETFDNSRSFGVRAVEAVVSPTPWLALRGTYDNMLGLRHPWLVRGEDDMESYFGAASVRWGRARALFTTLEAGRREYPGEEDDVYQTSWLLSQGVELSPATSLELGGWLGRWYDRDDWSIIGSARFDVGNRFSLRPSVSYGDHAGSNISGGSEGPGSGREPESELRGALGLRYEVPGRWGVEPAIALGSVSDDRDDDAFEGTLIDASARLWTSVGRVVRLEGFLHYQSPPGTSSFWVVGISAGFAVSGGG